MDFQGLGIFATPDEVAEIKALAEKAANTPVMTLRSDLPDFASVARKGLYERVHEIALARGLPDFKGYYGINLETREFVKEVENG